MLRSNCPQMMTAGVRRDQSLYTVPGTGLRLSMITSTQAAAAGGSSAPVRASYSSPGYSIAIVGHPWVTGTGQAVVRVRYSCSQANDVHIGVRVLGQDNVHSNRFARFGYPFQPALCDDFVHVVAVSVAAHAASTAAPLRPRDVVSVAVDLIDYGPSPVDGPIGAITALAGGLLENVRLRGSRPGQ